MTLKITEFEVKHHLLEFEMRFVGGIYYPKNQSFYLRSVFFKAQIPIALSSNKMEFCIFRKANNSIATKLQVNLLNNSGKT